MQFAKFFLEKRFRFFFSALVDVIILNMISLIIFCCCCCYFLHNFKRRCLPADESLFLFLPYFGLFIIWMLLNHSDAAALRTKFICNDKQPFSLFILLKLYYSFVMNMMESFFRKLDISIALWNNVDTKNHAVEWLTQSFPCFQDFSLFLSLFTNKLPWNQFC